TNFHFSGFKGGPVGAFPERGRTPPLPRRRWSNRPFFWRGGPASHQKIPMLFCKGSDPRSIHGMAPRYASFGFASRKPRYGLAIELRWPFKPRAALQGALSSVPGASRTAAFFKP